MKAKYNSGEIIIGAGTVMDAATARIAILAGAEYIVSPYFDPETVKTCNRYGVPSMPGIYTPTEAVHAMECGADVLKVFPGDIAGPAFIKDIHGPIPNAVMMPSGGVVLTTLRIGLRQVQLPAVLVHPLLQEQRQATTIRLQKQASSLCRESKRQEQKWLLNNKDKTTPNGC